MTELRASKLDIGGVGVFAIQDIEPRTKVGYDNDGVWYFIGEIRRYPKAMRRLITKFGIRNKRNNAWWAPSDLSRIGHVWYINNDSENPNVSENLFSLRLIRKGEELTASYDDVEV